MRRRVNRGDERVRGVGAAAGCYVACPVRTLSPTTGPYDLGNNRRESDDCTGMRTEAQGLYLTKPLKADQTPPLGPLATIVGARVSSTLLHFDRVGTPTQ